jgi:anti-sigma factor RsiW
MNRHLERHASSCDEREFELAELIDGTLPADRETELRSHLSGCARCRAFLRDLQDVDHELADALPCSPLAEDFDARLASRIAGLERTPARDVARAEADREYRGTLDALKRGLRVQTALNALAAASVAGGLVVGMSSAGPRLVHATGFTGNVNDILVTVVTSVALAVGLLAARRMASSPFIG